MEIENIVLKQIWEDRYKKNGETLDENLRRVANYIGSDAKDKTNFYNVMNKGLFFPAGRTMSNSAIGTNLTLNNCFVANFVEDNIEDIFDKVKLGALTHKRGGGIGYDFSKLRPKGSMTSNDAIASGVCSFMDVFNTQTATILQGGRRGANMGILSIYHPDIFEYLAAKSFDEGRLTHFNLSIMVDDDFMVAKNNNEKIILHYPIYDEKGLMISDPDKWVYTKEFDANELWDLIMTNAYNTGEYGVFFYDNMNRDNNTYYIETIVSTNPCFTGDMKLLTSKGYKSFRELNGTNVELVNYKGDKSQGKVWSNGIKDIIKLKLSNGKEIKCTPDHRFMLNDGTECKAEDTLKKRVMLFKGQLNNNIDNLYVKLGFIQGDGCTGRINSESHKGMEINMGYHDDDIRTLFAEELVGVTHSKSKSHAYYINGFNELLLKLMFDGAPLPERVFPMTYTTWDQQKKSSFLNGCYSANGSIITKYRISYKATSKVFILQLQKTLKNDFDIDSYFTTNKAKVVAFSNGDYECKESYDLNIGKTIDVIKFYNTIGFTQKYKIENLENLIAAKSPKVTSIGKCKQDEVFDFSEPLTHWGTVEGVIAHNCGEYMSGLLYGKNPDTKEEIKTEEYMGACNLGSFFLHNFVHNPFTSKVEINYVELGYAITIGVRLLDNIIDINKFPHPYYENYQKNMRTIGIGDTGIADVLAMFNMKYGSKEAIKFTDELENFITKKAYWASIELAKEKGSFPFLNKEKFIQSGFIQKHIKKDPEWQRIADAILKYGIRNARIRTEAPTGTLSLTYGNNCSSGLEPIFSLSYDRKVKIGGQDDSNIQIVKMEDYAYGLWKQTTKDNVVKEDIFVTAMDLPVQAHLDMLKTIAFHIDMSCSKTINIPTDYPYEETKKVYDYCWNNGIKGCTIFRPNPIRQGIMITENQSKSVEVKDELPRGVWKPIAPDTLYPKRKIYIGCGKINLFIGWSAKEHLIQDLYVKRSGAGGCEKNIDTAVISMSGMLRLGGNLDNIVKAFEGLGGCNSFVAQRAKGIKLNKGSSCGTAILNEIKLFQSEMDKNEIKTILPEIIVETEDLRTLEETLYLKKNGEIAFAKHYNKCPECGTELINSGGCVICRDCSWSKCS